jgi:bacterioferritin-associated ferredoxin
MNPDAEICLCFHVTRRKLENFARRRSPRVVSQMSECGGAGTGCGWCVPFLTQIFKQSRSGAASELEQLSPQEYEQRRAQYVRSGGGTPPPGATPLPDAGEPGA